MFLLVPLAPHELGDASDSFHLWLTKAAIADQIKLDAPLYRQKTEAAFLCVHSLLGEVFLGFGEGERRTALVLAQQFEMPSRVMWAAQF